MIFEVKHDHVESILSALKFSFNSAECYKTYLISDSGVKVSVSSSFIRIFSRVIASTAITSQDANQVVFVPLKLSTLENLLMFLYNGGLFSADKRTLDELLQAAQILDIDFKNWSIGGVGVVKKEIDESSVNFHSNEQVKVGSVTIKSEKVASRSTARSYHCHPCAIKLSSLPELTQHINHSHSEVIFELKTNTKLDLQIMEMIEKNERMWRCKVCEKTSNKKANIRFHAESHIKGLSHICHICRKIFTTRPSLQKHVSDYHIGMSYNCHICGKQDMSKGTYKKHKRCDHKT